MSIARASLCAALAVCALAAALAQSAPPAPPPAPPPATPPAPPPATPPLAPLAHSALIAVDAAPGARGLTLRVRRATDKTPLVVNDVAVTIDGRSEPATGRADGSWFVPRPAGTHDTGKMVDVTVGHDGIREVLSGRLGAPAAAPGAATSGSSSVMSSSRKQLLWWILNIVIVLIAAIAISRRMS